MRFCSEDEDENITFYIARPMDNKIISYWIVLCRQLVFFYFEKWPILYHPSLLFWRPGCDRPSMLSAAVRGWGYTEATEDILYHTEDTGVRGPGGAPPSTRHSGLWEADDTEAILYHTEDTEILGIYCIILRTLRTWRNTTEHQAQRSVTAALPGGTARVWGLLSAEPPGGSSRSAR